MPVTPSAAKALRRDRRRAAFNRPIRKRFKEAVKKARLQPTAQNLKTAYRALDRAAKQGLIHKNRAARLKARLSAFMPAEKRQAKKTPAKTKKIAKKTSPRAKKGAKKAS